MGRLHFGLVLTPNRRFLWTVLILEPPVDW